MKKTHAVVLLTLAGSTAAIAAPRESVTFTAQPSGGLIGTNPTLTATFNGSDGGGSYNATYLTVNGSYTRTTASWFSEASIRITPPDGTPFIMQPFNTQTFAPGGAVAVTTANTPAGSYTIPVSTFTTAGVWTFEFFDRWDDVVGGADGTWSNVTVTLNDGTPPAAAPIGAAGHTFPDVTVSGLTAAPGFDQSFTAPAGTTVVGIRLRAQGTGITLPNANTTVTATNAVRVRVTPPGQAALAAGVVFGVDSASTSVGELILSLPTAVDSGAGDWRVEAFESAAGNTTFLHTLAVELLPLQAPAAVDLGTLVANTPAVGNATVTATGQTKWFKFVMNDTLDALTNKGLEIDTEGSTTTDAGALLNTSIGLYTSGTGARVNADFVDGTQSLAMLTFGIDNHAAPGDGLAYNGRDGAALAAGEYYVAVTAGDTGIGYQPGLFGVTNTSTQLGAVRLNVQLRDPGAVAPAADDLGTLAGNPDSSELITSHTVAVTAGQVKWMKFSIEADAVAGGSFLDIFTDADTTAGDTELGVYTNDGNLVVSDDDDGAALKTFLSFGAGGGSTVGDLNNGGAATASDGRDGNLTAGTYYVAASIFDTTFNTQFWSVTSTGATAGDIVVKFATNIPPDTGSPCGPADIGAAGGEPGSDSHLDNNDFIAFITYFFAQDPIADMGVAGGEPGSDSTWDNNDFIAFINHFFAGPVSCR